MPQAATVLTATYRAAPTAVDIILDNEDSGVSYTGCWPIGSGLAGKYGNNYRYIYTSSTGTATYNPRIPVPGNYAIRIHYPPHAGRATNVQVTVNHTGGADTFRVNMQTGGRFDLLGTGPYTLDDHSTVVISNQGASGTVGADAFKFTPVP
jgi:hypothetical protein